MRDRVLEASDAADKYAYEKSLQRDYEAAEQEVQPLAPFEYSVFFLEHCLPLLDAEIFGYEPPLCRKVYCYHFADYG